MSLACPCTPPIGWWSMIRELGSAVRLFLGSGREQPRRHRGRLPHTERRHIRPHVLHGVVDREARRHRATGRVQVDVDLLLGIFRLEEEQLGDDHVRGVVGNRRSEKDDPVAQQSRVDVEVALAPLALFDHIGNQGHLALRIVADSPGWTGPLHAESERTGPGAAVARWTFGSNLEIPVLARVCRLARRAWMRTANGGKRPAAFSAIDRPGYRSGGDESTSRSKYLYFLRF